MKTYSFGKFLLESKKRYFVCLYLRCLCRELHHSSRAAVYFSFHRSGSHLGLRMVLFTSMKLCFGPDMSSFPFRHFVLASNEYAAVFDSIY